jgi:uncharacterized RDD family membrane protein YckC
MAPMYVLVINGKPEGPFSMDELKAKGLKPSDFVRTDDMDDYKEAHEVPELRAFFGFVKQNIAPQYYGSFDQRLLAAIIDLLLVSGVFIVMEGSSRQATYGKILLKIRVCNEDGSSVDYAKATARNLAKIVSNCTLFIGYLMSFFNKKQQCLHDMMAGTLVMKDRLV